MIYIHLIVLFIFISQDICIDIKLSLMNKNYNINNNKYPVVMTLKEDLNKKNDLCQENNIHFIYIIDFRLESSRFEHVREFMYTITPYLKNNDYLTFITFNDIIGNLQELKNIMDTPIQNYIKVNVQISFSVWDKEAKEQKTIEYKKKVLKLPNMINAIFYFTEDHNGNYIELLKNINNHFNGLEDFSLHLISADPTYPKSFAIFSDSINISYFPFNNKTKPDNGLYSKYIDETIKNTRNIKYKNNQIIITSKYNISIFYGKHYLNITPTIENGNYIYSLQKYQFISGKEYTYAFEVDLDENIKYGDRILNVKFISKYLNGTEGEPSFSSLKFYNAINYFNTKKYEFCRILLIETIELYLINSNTYIYEELEKKIRPINDFCKKDFYNKIEEEKFTDKIITLIHLNEILRNLFLNHNDF